VTIITFDLMPGCHPVFMLDVGLLRVTRDALGTAEGQCTQCGAYLSVTIPSDQSASEALSELFKEHLAPRHRMLGFHD
jgi:hypothetical protein